MFTTANQEQMRDLLKAFTDGSRELYNSHSYSAGYLESMVVHMLPYLPKRVQKDFIADIERATLRNKARLNEALLRALQEV